MVMNGSDRSEPLAPGAPAALAEGRRSSFERLTQRRLERSYRLAGVLLRDECDAQDAVHDAAVRAWTQWSDLRDPERFDAWFDRIVVNCCRDRLRRAPRTPRLDPILDVQTTDSPERVGRANVLRRALDRLSPDHRIVIVLRYFEELSVPEISVRSGLREGTVKSRIHYALRELRAALDAAERGSQQP